ncbi:MAG: SH3 domain-containing protein [Clostridia bacterium]|nr:SH3 domain-containing protein [Clostridia bacterium]
MKKTNFKIIIMLSFFITISTFIFAATTASNPTYGVTSSNVNFRSMATTSSTVIRQLSKGTKLKLVGNIDNFYIVQLTTNEVGLVYKDYIKSSSEALTEALSYTNLGKKQAKINTQNVNFRRGPSTSFQSITKLAQGTSVTVIGEINGWYLAVTSNNTVGMVYKPYITFNTSTSTPNTSNQTTTTDSNIQLVLNLINEARSKAGVSPLKLGATLPKIAQLKADDMVKNNYFSHTSPTYGTPFKMMSDYGIDYKAAGENIAGNPDIKAAVEAWLASDTHKQNLLSQAYNYIGIGIAKSDTYGYVIVAMFVGE